MQFIENEAFIKQVAFIGSGNVAFCLSKALQKKGVQIIQICSRNETTARELSNLLNCSYCTKLEHITRHADCYIIAVSDDSVMQVIADFPLQNIFVVHTSGSQPISVFENKFENYGVFYPLQTFSKTAEIDFNSVSFCLEANENKHLTALKNLAELLSPQIFELNSEQRKQLHLSAVFACNFVNHFYTIAYDLLQEAGISFELLKPLIIQTANKILLHKPADVQTGPARRNDTKTIAEHLLRLESSNVYKNLYTFVSKSITDYYT